MARLDESRLQYMTDQAGVKTAVIVPIDGFQELMEDIEDLAALAERREEHSASHEELKRGNARTCYRDCYSATERIPTSSSGE